MPALTEDDIAYAGVEGQRALLRDKQLTSVELLHLVLRRIARLDPQIGAFKTLFASAHAEASAADVALAAGDERPLLGVPIAVKDNLAVAGQRQSYGTGSPEPVATEDAEITRRLRAAGAVLVGSTHLPELALWPFTESRTFGPTRNPWDLDRTTGGSSGGSAAAVAAGMVAAAHGSDGGGSIRIPAACCGLVGLKPTRGFVSLAPSPGGEHWYGLSVAGCLTRSVADTVLVLNALQDTPLVLQEPGRLRVAWSTKAPVPTPVDPQVNAALHTAVDALGRLGHSTFSADPSYKGVQESFVVRYARGAADDLRALADPSKTEPRTRLVASVGRRIPRSRLERALRQGQVAAERFERLPADVLVTPVLAGIPRRIGALTGLRTVALAGRVVPFTPAWNVMGLPALAVPVGLSTEGLPLSVQLIGRAGSEQLLLSLAQQLLTELDLPDERPAM